MIVLDTADAVDAEAAEKARIALEARLLEEVCFSINCD